MDINLSQLQPGQAVLLHNPSCSKSRAADALLEQLADYEVTIWRYLEDPLSAETLREVASLLDGPTIELARTNEILWKALNIADDADEEIIQALAKNPALMQRPVVITAQGARIARPIEKIQDIL